MKIKTVYLDLDGVLADFEIAYNKVYKNLKDADVEELVKAKKSFSDINFFRDLPLMKDAKNLVKLVESYPVNVEVLTSVGKYGSKGNAVDKVIWLKKHFPQLANKFNYVTTSKAKSDFAKDDTLLIDDREKATLPFKSAGGEVVFYKGFASAKKLIEKILKNDK